MLRVFKEAASDLMLEHLGVFSSSPTVQVLEGVAFIDWEFNGFKVGITLGAGEDECGWWIFNGRTSRRGKWPMLKVKVDG